MYYDIRNQENKVRIMQNLTIFKPNELIGAIDQIKVNRLAKHLCNYFLQYAQKKLKFENYNSHSFELLISEVNQIANVGIKDYKLIEKSLTALMQPVTIRPEDDPKSYIKLVPIYMIGLDTQKGTYKFSLAPEILDILKNSDYFTKLELKEFNNLDSKHSIVLYEYLKRYENARKIPLMTIDEFRDITHTSASKTYDNFTDLKRGVIDVAVNEVNEKTPYNVSYEVFKTRTGRRPKVSEIQFYFSKKVLENSPTETEVQQAAGLEPGLLGGQEAQYAQEMTVDEAFGLFAEFKRVFTDLTKEQFNRATYKYTYKTLDKFAENIAKYSKTYTSEEFWQWLADRTQKLDFYNERAMQFEMIDVLNSFIANQQFKLQDQDVAQVRALVGAYGTVEYKDYVPQLADMYNMCFPKNTYNPFQKMLERMQ